MVNNGKRYTEEFKRQIIDLYLAGKPIVVLAEEYGIVVQTIYRWKKLYAPSIEVEEEQPISLKDYKELKNKIQQLEIENEILKNYSHIHQKTIDEIVSFIMKYQDHYPIKIICKVLGINRSTYYKCLNHKESKRDSENQKLNEDILAIYCDIKRCYGAPKIHR